MPSLHNPENRNNSHAAHPSLGKRTEDETPAYELDTNIFSNCGPMNEAFKKPEKPIKYVVVELSGTEYEHIVHESTTFKAASKWFNHQYRYGDAEECGALIMKVREDGTLTTEY